MKVAVSFVSALAAAAVSVAGSTVASAAATSPGVRPLVVGAAAHIPARAHAVGPMASSAPVDFDVAIAPRDPAALDAAVQAVSDPGSPDYHHFLAAGQFAAQYGPLPSTIASVRGTLTSLGLHPDPVSSNGLLVRVHATAAAAEAALHTRLTEFSVGGRIAHANTSPVEMPSSIAADVQAVVGLDTVNVPSPKFIRSAGGSPHAAAAVAHGSPTTACAEAQSVAKNQGAWTPSQLATAYGFDTAYGNGNLGAGQTIALYEEEPYSQSDVSTFNSCFGISTSVSPVNVDGGPTPGPGSGESILDIDNVISLAPSASVLVYQGPPGSSIDIWNKIVSDNKAKVVSTSWGICESQMGSGQATVEKSIFDNAAMNGQSILDASGDAGSEDCYNHQTPNTTLAVDDPGAQPGITAVGGTSLTSVSPPAEAVWNNCLNQGTSCAGTGGGSGGGGISSNWTMPSWQSGPGVQNAYTASSPCPNTSDPAGTTSCRQVPDVSAVADPNDGYIVYCTCNSGNGWGAAGGTSAAAPLWAALVALADEACNAPAGLLNPTLYKLGANNPSDFVDITSGNNDYTATNHGAYPATSAYDMASGWGTPTSALFRPGALCSSGGGTPTAGYWMLESDGTVHNFGTAQSLGNATGIGTAGHGSAAGITPTPDGHGYWVVSTTGFVQNFGDAPNLTTGAQPFGPVVTIASTSTGQGFWIATSQGDLVTAGDATSFGSPFASGLTLNGGIVNMVPTPDGKGYWMLGGDGGVFSYGDANFFGSMGGKPLNAPTVAIVPTSDGKGYWFVGSDGGIFAFGDAGFFGSSGQINPAQGPGGSNAFTPVKPINGMVATLDGHGYWMVASDGGVFAFGDAGFVGSLGGNPPPSAIVGIAPSL